MIILLLLLIYLICSYMLLLSSASSFEWTKNKNWCPSTMYQAQSTFKVTKKQFYKASFLILYFFSRTQKALWIYAITQIYSTNTTKNTPVLEYTPHNIIIFIFKIHIRENTKKFGTAKWFSSTPTDSQNGYPFSRRIQDSVL